MLRGRLLCRIQREMLSQLKSKLLLLECNPLCDKAVLLGETKVGWINLHNE